jgi:GABA(A) receptor-associated protein
MIDVNISRFKEKFSQTARTSECEKIMQLHPDRIPIICERGRFCTTSIPNLDKIKYLVPWDLTVGQFIYVIRRRLKLNPYQTIFIFCNNKIIKNTDIIGSIYESMKDKDRYLYFYYVSENVFGN